MTTYDEPKGAGEWKRWGISHAPSNPYAYADMGEQAAEGYRQQVASYEAQLAILETKLAHIRQKIVKRKHYDFEPTQHAQYRAILALILGEIDGVEYVDLPDDDPKA